MGYIECSSGGGGSTGIKYGSPILQVSNRTSTTSAVRMNDTGTEGFVSSCFSEVADGNNKKWVVTTPLDVIFSALSSGGYSTKWAIYKNGNILYSNSYFQSYGVESRTEITHLEIGDELYFTTWHSDKSSPTYDIVKVIPVFIDKPLKDYNLECLFYADNRNAATSERYAASSATVFYYDTNKFSWSNFSSTNSDRFKFKTATNINVKFRGISSGGYSTKWRVYVNDEIVYDTNTWIGYDVLVESDTISLNKDDIVYVKTWHNNRSGPTYEVSMLLKVE